LNEACVGLMHAGHDFARFEVDYFGLFERFVIFAPADYRNFEHGSDFVEEID
jgi:hypothetical protein